MLLRQASQIPHRFFLQARRCHRKILGLKLGLRLRSRPWKPLTTLPRTADQRKRDTPLRGYFFRKGSCFRHFSGRGISGGACWTRSPLYRKMAPEDGGRQPGRLFPRTARGGLRRQASDRGRAEATGQEADWAWAPMAIQSDQSPRSLRPRSVSFSRTSLRLVTPKFLHSMRSSAVRRTSSPMELMPSLVVHFRARTERLSSVIGWE